MNFIVDREEALQLGFSDEELGETAYFQTKYSVKDVLSLYVASEKSVGCELVCEKKMSWSVLEKFLQKFPSISYSEDFIYSDEWDSKFCSVHYEIKDQLIAQTFGVSNGLYQLIAYNKRLCAKKVVVDFHMIVDKEKEKEIYDVVMRQIIQNFLSDRTKRIGVDCGIGIYEYFEYFISDLSQKRYGTIGSGSFGYEITVQESEYNGTQIQTLPVSDDDFIVIIKQQRFAMRVNSLEKLFGAMANCLHYITGDIGFLGFPREYPNSISLA